MQLQLLQGIMNLNTSHVKVNLTITSNSASYARNLNTSHVKVNPVNTFPAKLPNLDLNTSHVKVNPNWTTVQMYNA